MARITYQTALSYFPGTKRRNIGSLLMEKSGNLVLRIEAYGNINMQNLKNPLNKELRKNFIIKMNYIFRKID